MQWQHISNRSNSPLRRMMKPLGLVETHHQLNLFETPRFVSVVEKVD